MPRIAPNDQQLFGLNSFLHSNAVIHYASLGIEMINLGNISNLPAIITL